MKSRLFAATIIIVSSFSLLIWRVWAQEPEFSVLPQPERHDINTPSQPFARHNEQIAERAIADISLGSPGVVFRYDSSYGVTGRPYIEDSSHLNEPYGVSVDSNDNLWVGESSGARAIKYNSSGAYQMSIGQAGINDPDNDQNLLASVADIAIGSSGNIWIADADTHRVVKYNASGEFQSQLGTTWENGSDNSHFNNPRGIGLDGDDNIYVSDDRNHRIQIFDASGVYTATIGVSGVSGSDNSHFDTPRHLAIDSANLLYVADAGNHRVQIFNVSNLQAISYVATIGVTGESGTDNSHFNYPMGVAVDNNYIYVADAGNYRVQIFNRSARAYYASITRSSSGDNSFWADVAVDSTGNIYVVDHNMRVLVFNSSLNYARSIGVTGVPYLTDADHFNEPRGLAVTADGGLLIVEEEGHRLIKLDKNGSQLWTVGEAGVYGTDTTHLDNPMGVAAAPNGDIYVADAWSNRIKIFDSGGSYKNSFGSHGTGNDELRWPTALAIASNGNIYVVDTNNYRVQIFDNSYAYLGTLGVTGESGADNNHFGYPLGVAVDSSGTVYVSDYGNSRVQVFDSNHAYVRTIGIAGECSDSFEHFCGPHHIAVDNQDRLYVADAWNNRVQVFDKTGAYLTTIGGSWGDNVGEMRNPKGVTVAADGAVYVADHRNYRIQIYKPGVSGWEQVNLNGFGKRNNSAIWALYSFSNDLYVSTINETTGGEVYRLSSGTWEQVVDGGFGDSANSGVNKFTEFNGSLYAGTMNYPDGGGSNGGQIWRSSTGNNGSWERVVNNGFSDATNCEVMSMADFNGYLYAGTWSCDTNTHGTEIWRSDSGGNSSWTRVMSDTTFGDSHNIAILSMEIFNNNLYVVTDNDTSGGEVWRTNNGTIWTQVNVDGFGSNNNTRVVSLVAFGENLYAGTWNSTSGGQIWRTANGTSWEQVVSDGFGKTDNKDIASLVVFDGELYTVSGNFVTGAEVWRSKTGKNGSWQKVIDTGFGGGRTGLVDWDIGAIVHNSSLYVGTFTFGNGGGKLWQKIPPAYIYLPVILKNYTPPFYGPNEIEPNDDAKTQANGPIISGQTYLGKLPPGDSKDYFYIDLQETHTIEIWLNNIPAGQDYDLVLYDANLTQLALSNDIGDSNEYILSDALQPGRYYIQAWNAGDGSSEAYHLKAVYR